MNGYFYELRLLTRHCQVLQESLTVTRNQLKAAQLGMYPGKQIIQSLGKLARKQKSRPGSKKEPLKPIWQAIRKCQ